MQYTTLLMDVDDTILDFQQCEYHALEAALTHNGLPFDQMIYERFSSINAALWRQFELNKITRAELRVRRFAELIVQCLTGFDDATQLADEYVIQLAEQAIYFSGAQEALARLSKVCSIYLITNGLKPVQRGRLAKAGLYAYIKDCFISDEMGVQKPMKAYFDRVLSRVNEQDTTKILVVGDSLTSDMQGGRNAGLTTCLYDPKGKVALPHPLCDFRITSLEELIPMCTGQ